MSSPEPQTETANVPRHVAIIMDGNGRWAAARGLPRVAGHRKGADAVRATVRAARELGIPYLTLFAFSSENWRRPKDEVMDLMELLKLYLRREIADLHRNGVRVRFIGDRHGLSDDICALMDRAAETTIGDTDLTLIIALNYGGQGEIVRAARQIAEDAAAGKLDPSTIDEACFAQRLDNPDVPAPDLLIRTSGEQRLSNFLLWQCAYSELVFDDTLWPDFGHAELQRAIDLFGERERRFGGRSG
ncbi:MAG: isoprenyl transferase [Minwuia sp.]|nr:isoprenyl transferase [Minwuia sp.]